MDSFGVLGTQIAGKYRIDRVLGEGGFGVVYAGFHLVIGQPVAVKLMKPVGGAPDRARNTDAFLREARVLFDLAHPAIVRLYDVGTTPTRIGDVPYVVLELIAGASLAEEVRRRQRGEAPPFAAHEILAIFDGLLDGLAAAHARGIAHRDLKPSNVMLTRDPAGALHAKILDFGTARSGGPGATVGPAGFTPLYAAPEQWDARFGQTGPATDVFAAGLLLAETALLTPTLAGEGMAQIAGAAMDGARRPRISTSRPDVPPALDAIVLSATRPAPGERFADAAQMRTALRSAFGAARSAGGPEVGAFAPAPLAFTVPPPVHAPPMPGSTGPAAYGGMIMVGGPPPPPGALTTNAPVQQLLAPSSALAAAPAGAPARQGMHPLSILALVIALSALAAVLAFSVVLVMFLRQPKDRAAAADPPPAATTPAATAPAPPGVAPAPATPPPAAPHRAGPSRASRSASRW